MLTYMAPLLVVDDLEAVRRFYRDLLGQKVRYDFGVNVTFEGDYAFHLRSSYQELLGESEYMRIGKPSHNAVLCFETDELDELSLRLQDAGAVFLHGPRELPWGQRAMRVYDPSGYLIEIGEDMQNVARRLYREGLSLDQVMIKTGMPREFIAQALDGATAHD